MHDENEIWDEFKWEEFMKEQDKKVDRYMELFYRYQDDPDRDERIAREMGWTWLLEDLQGQDGSIEPEEEEEDVEEGEEWKARSGIPQEAFEMNRCRHLPAYQKARTFATRAMRFVDQLPEEKRGTSVVVDFVSNAMITAAKIAGGTGIGDDCEELGGNIAYCKRGLAAANLAIAALREMGELKIVERENYLNLMKEIIEVRNLVAMHILDLREKFRRDTGT